MTYDQWFKSQQGVPYDGQYLFAEAAWEHQQVEIAGLQQINLIMQASYDSTIIEYMELNKELALLNKEMASELVESRNNDRTAMMYLHEVQAIVLSKDFLEMVKKVAGYKALCDQLGEALQIEYKRNVDNYHGASTNAKEALTAWRNSK